MTAKLGQAAFFQARLELTGQIACQGRGSYEFLWQGHRLPVFQFRSRKADRGDLSKPGRWVCYCRNRNQFRVSPRKLIDNEIDNEAEQEDRFIVSGIVQKVMRSEMIVLIRGNSPQTRKKVKFTVKVGLPQSRVRPSEFWLFEGSVSPSTLRLIPSKRAVRLRSARPIRKPQRQ